MPKLKYGLITNTRIKMFRSKWQYKRKGIGEKIECCLKATWGPRLYIDNPEPTLPLRNKESIRSSKKKQRFSNTLWTLFFILCQLFFCYAIFDNHVDSTFLFAIQTCFTIMEKAVLTLILNCHVLFQFVRFLYKKAIIQGIKKLDYFSIYRV